ncbi:MAG TPA: tRNA uracil 4-sulfurtransferase ThiI [Candidatus Moranbacteria bacterium]|jgi:thiamine biosynthesis protein ThiI|nr:tRNA 4-thiouridine(8) synthase ThiI [Candidatus Moranbacteria bacterium]HPX94076.1 tRNA uracil 4-sulfurtransferase ThiI [Candidatus Moranbacteria bacterium]HQB59373.1 tRNA uracil 4-sulfurtransferase ThiI [Candidatus Moranbacteria bacterium]
MIPDTILIHYGEIALKGKNRNFFEERLIQNIKSQIESFAPGSFEYVKKFSGSILIKPNKNGIKNIEKVKGALLHTFGITNFHFAVNVKQDIEALKKTCWELFKDENFETFCINTRRSNKNFHLNSAQINEKVGEYVLEKFQGKKAVKLKKPDLICHINIVEKSALVSLEKIKGLGGMPAGTQGRAMVLMSGGFDSPIAAWQMLRRGVNVSYAHFHSIPYTSRASVEKVESLISALKKFGSSGNLYLIPFAEVQKEIMMKTPAPLRVILYRRFMMRIAENLAKKERALVLVTGDSVGQVASQTLENIFAVNEAATLPVFRPLIGTDKEEIIQTARKIGTYDISRLPHDDCCTRLMPKSPEIRAKLSEVLAAEKNLNVEKIIQETLEKTEKVAIK